MAIDLDDARAKILQLPPHEQVAAMEALEQYVELLQVETAQRSFLGFVRHMWPDFIESAHHRVIGDAFDRVEKGELNRVIINMPPRHTKSEFASKFFPAYCLGRDPKRKIMQTSNTTELAVGFGRHVRNIVNSQEYGQVFSEVALSSDSKAAGRWNTNHGGEYFAAGIGAALAGRGANILVIDDPHTEQEAILNSVRIYDNAYEWYITGPRQRLQPGGAIIVVMTRWHKRDLTGRLIEDMIRGDGDQWEVIELPAILDEYTDHEKPLWPGFWTLEELQATRDSLKHSNRWHAQYQQNPTSEEGAIVKREWWRVWEGRSPPMVDYIIQCWDTAYTAKSSADYSACSTWGVWTDEDQQSNIILLDAFKERIDFPELKQRAVELWRHYNPDNVLIEAKASGWPLIHELRRMGIPVTDVTYSRGEDKHMRINSVTDIFRSGLVWAPDTAFANMMIEEFAAFPYGDSDDLMDTGTMALRRFREGGLVRLPTDEPWDTGPKRPMVADYY